MCKNNTLIVWDGMMVATETAGEKGSYDITWHGTAFAHFNCKDSSKVKAPTRGAFSEFCESPMQFRVKGTAKSIDGSTDDNLFKPFLMNLSGGEGWDLNGQKLKDIKHEVFAENLRWRGSDDEQDSLVYGRGVDEFGGDFISVGWMRPGNRITMARRYVHKSDKRFRWTMGKLRNKILDQIFDEEEEEEVIPPWKIEIFNDTYEGNNKFEMEDLLEHKAVLGLAAVALTATAASLAMFSGGYFANERRRFVGLRA